VEEWKNGGWFVIICFSLYIVIIVTVPFGFDFDDFGFESSFYILIFLFLFCSHCRPAVNSDVGTTVRTVQYKYQVQVQVQVVSCTAVRRTC
jgi:hypothetical protein